MSWSIFLIVGVMAIAYGASSTSVERFDRRMSLAMVLVGAVLLGFYDVLTMAEVAS